MKKIHWIGLALIAIAIGIFINASKDMTSYASFEQVQKAGYEMKIVGELRKDMEIYYEPEQHPNYFSFYVSDNEGETKKVVLHGAKPQDFELSEKIVITGKFKGEDFIASDLLLKCPSKYKDEEVYIRSNGSNS